MSKKDLINDIRFQREALDGLLGRLQDKSNLALLDYQICESTAEAVEKGLQRIRSLSIDEFVKESLWGNDISQVVA